MKRIRAIGRCIYHAFLPPFVERWLTGSVHYYPYWNYWGHGYANIRSAIQLALFMPLSEEERQFHKLD